VHEEVLDNAVDLGLVCYLTQGILAHAPGQTIRYEEGCVMPPTTNCFSTAHGINR
jgi:hypothetical protein